jgi:hypothetical protein
MIDREPPLFEGEPSVQTSLRSGAQEGSAGGEGGVARHYNPEADLGGHNLEIRNEGSNHGIR